MLLAFDDVGPGPVVVSDPRVPVRSDDVVPPAIERRLDLPSHPAGSPRARQLGGARWHLHGRRDGRRRPRAPRRAPDLRAGGPRRGLSMGGYVALSIAARHPERLKGPAAAQHPSLGRLARGGARSARNSPSRSKPRGDTESVVAAMLPKVFCQGHVRASSRRSLPGCTTRMSRTPARAIAGTLRGLAIRPDRTGNPCRESRCRHLSSTGPIRRLDPARRVANPGQDSSPRPGWSIIPEAGHMAPVWRIHQATDAAILEFLEESLVRPERVARKPLHRADPTRE